MKNYFKLATILFAIFIYSCTNEVDLVQPNTNDENIASLDKRSNTDVITGLNDFNLLFPTDNMFWDNGVGSFSLALLGTL